MTIRDLINSGIDMDAALEFEVAVIDDNNCYTAIYKAFDDGIETIWFEDKVLSDATIHLKINDNTTICRRK